MLADIDRGSNPRSGFSLARGNGACAPRTLSRGRVAERRGDGVKHSTTPDDQGVTAFTVHEAASVFLYCWAVDFRDSGGLVPAEKGDASRTWKIYISRACLCVRDFITRDIFRRAIRRHLYISRMKVLRPLVLQITCLSSIKHHEIVVSQIRDNLSFGVYIIRVYQNK